MIGKAPVASFMCAILFAALALAGCSASGEASQNTSPAATSAETKTQAYSLDEATAALHDAAESTFSSVAFSMKTETTVTGGSSNGQSATQSMMTSTKGQIDRSGSKPRIHMDYKAQSSMQPGVTAYEMFISADNLIVRQNEQLFVDVMTDEMLNTYANSITAAISADEIDAILDMAADCKMQSDNGKKTITVTVDKDKLAKSDLVDDSSLPETSQVATMVISYDIDADNRFDAVRIMSSTSGSPTYRVSQTYDFSQYDAVEMPEWPDLNAYIAQLSGIMTDAAGRMYILGDDGQPYYVTDIDPDGTVHFNTGTYGTATTDEGETVYYYYETADIPDGNAGGTTMVTENGTRYVLGEDGTRYAITEDGTTYIIGDDGFAYVTDDDGTQYAIAEDGTTYVVGADGTKTIIEDNEAASASESDAAESAADGNAENMADGSDGDSGSEPESEDKGRAYITADDGTIHFLDEEGSRLFENEDGTSYFIDADGNFYFLNMGDDEES